MHFVEVKDKKEKKEFLNLPVRLYKHDPNWIRPLDKDIENVFDPAKNKFFKYGECIRWILLNDQNETIGRVAAFYSERTATKDNDQPTGGMGFFECINDQKAAHKLFNQCREWLIDKGMEAMDGPINFGSRDRWWGLLAEGFTQPTYCSNYNPPYYKELFESYGFQVYFRQYTYARKIKEGGLDPKVYEKAQLIRNNPDIVFRHIRKKNLSKYAEDFRYVYNKAWAKHAGLKEMTPEQAMAIMKQIKPVIDEKIIWFGYHKDEPIAFYVNLPELNQIIKHVNGKLDLIGKLKFLWHKKMKTCRKIFGVSFGVVPEFQGKGVEAAIVEAITEVVWSKESHYEDYEMNWIGDFNPKMMRVCENVGGKIHKTHITYRKLFDESKPFKRAPIIN